MEENAENAAAYSDGDTNLPKLLAFYRSHTSVYKLRWKREVRAFPKFRAVYNLPRLNKKAVAATSLAAVAGICLAVAFPIALSPNGGGIPPIALELGEDYAVGAGSPAKILENFAVCIFTFGRTFFIRNRHILAEKRIESIKILLEQLNLRLRCGTRTNSL